MSLTRLQRTAGAGMQVTEDGALRVAVVEDDPATRLILIDHVERCAALSLIAAYPDAVSAANQLSTHDIDIALLDVEMPEMSGIELARLLSEDVSIIVVTSNSSHAAEAFDIDAVDFLVKPVNYGRFLRSVERVRRRRLELHAPSIATAAVSGAAGNGLASCITVRCDRQDHIVPLDDILRLEAERDYVYVVTERDTLFVHSTLKALLARLPESEFLQVHRSHVVRIAAVEVVAPSLLVVRGSEVPIGASRKKAVLQRLKRP